MQCRIGCGACCIIPSISSSIPGMPNGKQAFARCIQLDENNKCKLFRSDLRPKVCSSLKPCFEMCGTCTSDAVEYLTMLENLTS